MNDISAEITITLAKGKSRQERGRKVHLGVVFQQSALVGTLSLLMPIKVISSLLLKSLQRNEIGVTMTRRRMATKKLYLTTDATVGGTTMLYCHNSPAISLCVGTVSGLMPINMRNECVLTKCILTRSSQHAERQAAGQRYYRHNSAHYRYLLEW